jgi:hypothetical protein
MSVSTVLSGTCATQRASGGSIASGRSPVFRNPALPTSETVERGLPSRCENYSACLISPHIDGLVVGQLISPDSGRLWQSPIEPSSCRCRVPRLAHSGDCDLERLQTHPSYFGAPPTYGMSSAGCRPRRPAVRRPNLVNPAIPASASRGTRSALAPAGLSPAWRCSPNVAEHVGPRL